MSKINKKNNKKFILVYPTIDDEDDCRVLMDVCDDWEHVENSIDNMLNLDQSIDPKEIKCYSAVEIPVKVETEEETEIHTSITRLDKGKKK